MIEYINKVTKIYNWFSKNELIIKSTKTYFTFFKNINTNMNFFNNTHILYKKILNVQE